MRWKFKSDWDFLFNCWGNIGVSIFAAGWIAEILEKPHGIQAIIGGTLIIVIAWIGKSLKVDN